MRTILSIFALSMFLSCQEDTSSGFRQCGRMILSDALPVQFWLSECDTFNEHEAGGVHHVCWCQPWNSSDPITVQFVDEPSQTFSLMVVDSEGLVFLENIPEISAGLYQITYTPNDVEGQIQIRIISGYSTISTISPPTIWADPIMGDASFTVKDATFFQKTVNSFTGRTSASQSVTIPSGVEVAFSYTVEVTNTWTGAAIPLLVSFRMKDGAGGSEVSTGLLTTSEKTITANGVYNYNEVLTLTGDANTFEVYIDEDLSSGTAVVKITVGVGQVLYVADPVTVAKSDCLEIAESHDETIFIEYSNDKNYAGLVYDNDSPDTTFGIRVPCRFVHEVEKEEDEAMELTSSVIITSSQVITQRLLEVKHAPYYFHKKVRRVLKHQNVSIFDKQWKKEEKYEVIEGKKTWPLKAATCLLTEKNSVVRNVS